MIIMSVDLGDARTGIAVSDNGESFAFPKTVINEYNKTKSIRYGGFFMRKIISQKMHTSNQSIEERATEIAQYIINTKDTVRGAAKEFGISKSTVHTDVTLQNGKQKGQPIPESIEIKGVFLSTKNPVVRLGLLIK